ncbi:hypothetical protein DFH27DRAFT_607070 [Peziza echinospora]|nr:hypothetical protein DFH27DRAFT_607070 [Peziza echinospora]
MPIQLSISRLLYIICPSTHSDSWAQRQPAIQEDEETCINHPQPPRRKPRRARRPSLWLPASAGRGRPVQRCKRAAALNPRPGAEGNPPGYIKRTASASLSVWLPSAHLGLVLAFLPARLRRLSEPNSHWHQLWHGWQQSYNAVEQSDGGEKENYMSPILIGGPKQCRGRAHACEINRGGKPQLGCEGYQEVHEVPQGVLVPGQVGKARAGRAARRPGEEQLSTGAEAAAAGAGAAPASRTGHTDSQAGMASNRSQTSRPASQPLEQLQTAHCRPAILRSHPDHRASQAGRPGRPREKSDYRRPRPAATSEQPGRPSQPSRPGQRSRDTALAAACWRPAPLSLRRTAGAASASRGAPHSTRSARHAPASQASSLSSPAGEASSLAQMPTPSPGVRTVKSGLRNLALTQTSARKLVHGRTAYLQPTTCQTCYNPPEHPPYARSPGASRAVGRELLLPQLPPQPLPAPPPPPQLFGAAERCVKWAWFDSALNVRQRVGEERSCTFPQAPTSTGIGHRPQPQAQAQAQTQTQQETQHRHRQKHTRQRLHHTTPHYTLATHHDHLALEPSSSKAAAAAAIAVHFC